MPRSTILGRRVKHLRQANGLSQTDLARRTLLSQPRISQIETGYVATTLPRRTLTDLADALGVGLDALIAGDPLYESLAWESRRSARPIPVDLPIPTSPLVGRDAALADLDVLLRDGDVRLVTLTGPGGVGKTHLALRAALAVENAFADGVIVVSLASCRDAAQLIAAVAHAVGLRERDASPLRDRLLAALHNTDCLLLLDNAEHLLAATADLAAALLAGGPRPKLLITSRATVRVHGEREYPVTPLAAPNPAIAATAEVVAEAPAVLLFVQRVRTILPSFAVTDENAAAVAEICRRLDGLPLAIELAAPRLKTSSPHQVLRRLDDRLALLANGAFDLPARQQTLRAAIAWSFALLTPPAQDLFTRLAVFAGGFTPEAAEYVSREARVVSRENDTGAECRVPSAESDRRSTLDSRLSTLDSLVDQSLLTRSVLADGSVRFTMLDTIREYGLERLAVGRPGASIGAGAPGDEGDAVRARHLAWCLELAEDAAPRLFTAEEANALRRLDREAGNLQAALRWALTPDRAEELEVGLRLAGALTDAWYLGGRLSEGRAWLEQAIATGGDRHPAIGQARVLVGACLIAQAQGENDRARGFGELGLALARDLDDRPTVARALLLLGTAAMIDADLDRARALLDAALGGFRAVGNVPWTAVALVDLALVAYRQDDHPRAERYAEEALAVAGAIGDDLDAGLALGLLGDIAQGRGDRERAAVCYRESLVHGGGRRGRREIANAVSGFAGLAVAAKDMERAARLLGAADALYRSVELRVPPPARPTWSAVFDQTRSALPPDGFGRAWASGQAMTPEQAIAEALTAFAL